MTKEQITKELVENGLEFQAIHTFLRESADSPDEYVDLPDCQENFEQHYAIIHTGLLKDDIDKEALRPHLTRATVEMAITWGAVRVNSEAHINSERR